MSAIQVGTILHQKLKYNNSLQGNMIINYDKILLLITIIQNHVHLKLFRVYSKLTI